jgi:hypothetical protein
MTKREQTEKRESIKIVIERQFGKGAREVDFQIIRSELAKEAMFVSAKKLAARLTGLEK